MILTHSNKCSCGEEFDPVDGALIPNTKDKEFYGGRINFFREAKCKCGKEYILLIEKNFNYNQGMGFNIVDMIDMTNEKEYPLETLKGRLVKPKIDKIEEKIETIEHRLTTIVERDVQVEALKTRTMKELQALCRENKVKFKVTESRLALINKLLDANPGLVVSRET